MLVDTSIWIDFFNGIGSEKMTFFRMAIDSDSTIYTTATVIQEALQGIRDDKKYQKIKGYLLDYEILLLDQVEAAIGAASLYRAMRKNGLTVPNPSDCLIAYYANYFDVPILHNDKDFTVMAQFGFIKEIKV